MKKLVIGLIGGMGSGKSRVAEAFGRRGARVVSGDHLGHEALLQPAIKERLVKRWGTKVLGDNGQINRRRVAEIVFADPGERRALEELSFRWIERRIGEEIAAAQSDPNVGLIVLDAAIMLEAGWDRFCDRIVYVDAPREIRLKRLADQRGWTAAEVEARERAQWPLDQRRSRAEEIVDNSGSMDKLAEQVDGLLDQWKTAK
jgi:dephospho-CoA kinase